MDNAVNVLSFMDDNVIITLKELNELNKIGVMKYLPVVRSFRKFPPLWQLLVPIPEEIEVA